MAEENRKQHFEELSEQSLSTEAASDGGSVDFRFPWRRDFIHSDVEYSVTNRDSIASSSSGRPASTPGNFPDIHWLPPISDVNGSQPEEVEKNLKIRNRVDAWISRLDRLISDSSQTDQSLELCDITPELFSSQDTLTSGSSSLTEELPDDDEEEEKRVTSSYLSSLDEVFGGTVSQSTLAKKDCLERAVHDGPFQQRMHEREAQPLPEVLCSKATLCSDISQACKILNTRYKMEGIAVRKPVMTWSKWNVSQVVRGPHAKSPIWNPTLKRKWDRPSSVVFQELNKEITRRNEELEEIVRRKTETVQYRSSAPSPVPSPSLNPPTLTSCIPPPSSIRLITSSPPSPSWVGNPSDPPNPPVPLSTCPQPGTANPVSEVNRSYFIMPAITPQATSRTDPGGYPHATLTIDDAEDAGPSSLPSAAGSSATASSQSSSSSSGMGLLRRMVKSFWNIFLGDRGCHGEGSKSNNGK